MSGKTEAKAVGHGVEEFRQQYDRAYIVPRRISDALKKLGDRWMREIDFAKFAGIGTQDISAYRAEFEQDFVVELGGRNAGKRVWCGTKAMAAKLREIQQ